MWLINVHSLRLEHFVGERIPRYAILSHTWDEEEVTFDMMQELRSADDSRATEITRMRGFQKIKGTCQLAIKEELGWAWVDTCCIDKRSSAELSEAINSMFGWYEGSRVCYVYFADLKTDWTLPLDDEFFERWAKCRWFRRGWTLQELVAPTNVHFFDSTWRRFGDKQELCHAISRISEIPTAVLRQPSLVLSYSIAARMSWAAYRSTTRDEDMAYCLLGLFAVNLPLLYGEGRRAFRRLQEELLRMSDDETLLARCNAQGTVFACSPDEFLAFRDAVPEREPNARPELSGATRPRLTNLGLEFTGLPIWGGDRLLFRLRCRKGLFGPSVYLMFQPQTPVKDWDKVTRLSVRSSGVEALRLDAVTDDYPPIQMIWEDWKHSYNSALQILCVGALRDELSLVAAWEQATITWDPTSMVVVIETLPTTSNDILLPFRLSVRDGGHTDFLLWVYYSVDSERGLVFLSAKPPDILGTLPDDYIYDLLKRCRDVDLGQVQVRQLAYSSSQVSLLPQSLDSDNNILSCTLYKGYYLNGVCISLEVDSSSSPRPSTIEIPSFDRMPYFIGNLPKMIARVQSPESR